MTYYFVRNVFLKDRYCTNPLCIRKKTQLKNNDTLFFDEFSCSMFSCAIATTGMSQFSTNVVMLDASIVKV